MNLNKILEIKFTPHLAILHLETPDFIRPLIGHVVWEGCPWSHLESWTGSPKQEREPLLPAVTHIGWGDQTSFMQIIMWPIKKLHEVWSFQMRRNQWVAKFIFSIWFKFISYFQLRFQKKYYILETCLMQVLEIKRHTQTSELWSCVSIRDYHSSHDLNFDIWWPDFTCFVPNRS